MMAREAARAAGYSTTQPADLAARPVGTQGAFRTKAAIGIANLTDAALSLESRIEVAKLLSLTIQMYCWLIFRDHRTCSYRAKERG